MACSTPLHDLHKYSISIAVKADFDYLLCVSAGFAFNP